MAGHRQESPRTFWCPIEGCDKGFSTKFNSERHVASSHFKQKPFQCLVCHRYFAFKQVLIDHFNSHTGDRPFRCEVCGKTYKHSSRFSFHIRRHKANGDLAQDETRKRRTFKLLPFRVATLTSRQESLQLPPFEESARYLGTLPVHPEFERLVDEGCDFLNIR